MDQIKPTLSQSYTYASKCTKCMIFFPIIDPETSFILAKQYLIYVMVVICYLIIVVPALRRTFTCDIIVIFITCTFCFMRIIRVACMTNLELFVSSLILAGIVAFISINPSIKRYVEIFSDEFVVMLSLDIITISLNMTVRKTMIAIFLLCYPFLFFYMETRGWKIEIRALTCSLLFGQLISTGYFSFLTLNWIGMLGYIDQNWEFNIIKAGFVLLAVLHFLMFKYTRKFYVEEDRKSLIPQ